jgi:hypothetical protein
MNTLAGVKPYIPVSEPEISVDSKVTAGSISTVDTKSTHREFTADVTSIMYANTQQQTGINVFPESNRQPVKLYQSVDRLCSFPPRTPAVQTPAMLKCPHCEYRTNNSKRLKAERRLLIHMEQHTRQKSVEKYTQADASSPKVATSMHDTSERHSSCHTSITSTEATSATRDMATQTLPATLHT